MQLNTELR